MADGENVIAPGAKLEKLAGEFKFTEGSTCVATAIFSSPTSQTTVRGATNGVSVFDPPGKMIGHIDVPEKWSANVSFGGADRRPLFITASESIYAIRLCVKGANLAK